MMVRTARAPLVIFVVALVAAGCSPASTSRRGQPADGSGGARISVTKVADGDTIHVTFQGHDERVRLIGIDTPEVAWYGGRGDCFGEEAGLFARRRLSGRSVRLGFDVDRRDRYGRLLAYLYLGDELFNLTLVQLGYARADPVPPDTRLAAQFAQAEAGARLARRGLWSACPLEVHG
jgi:micrococcal nuclease